MKESFDEFFKEYLDSWRLFSLKGIEKVVSPDYTAREIRGKEVYDFGYEESIDGWNHAFNGLRGRNAEWILEDDVIVSLKEDEMLAIIWASLIIDDKPIKTASLFFQTFRWEQGSWKMVRSYIEAEIPIEKMLSLKLTTTER
ncbi:flavoprotein [Fictibacillus sp. 18YEL24]|uniref:flavoprotein n=1 Tax=Fictibacillus sp. 18YEL24 TaxID=2745875 RepID=UPI0018CCE9D3|nr:flavoprotein [Fictibacillus sp. 18YEL24]MBH0168061.1 flavoprotein [Fictibacillus sp. 18YEL24]